MPQGGFTYQPQHQGFFSKVQSQQPSTRSQQPSMSFDMPQGGFTYQPQHQGFFSKVQSQQPSTRSQQPSTRSQQPSTRPQQPSTRPQQTWNRPTFFDQFPAWDGKPFNLHDIAEM